MGVAARPADHYRGGMSGRTVDLIVTYLAMQAPPRQLPPMPATPRLHLMRAEHIPLAYYRYLYRAVGGPWLWFERLLLDDESLSRRVHKDAVEIHVLYANGSPAGYFELDFGKQNRTNLAYFGLIPDWTGRKIGPWLLGSAISAGFSRGAEQLTVNTCTLDHPAALPLYRRLGFQPKSEERRRLAIPPQIPIPNHIAARMRP
jgi:GNAT superfamily N-acetyltransferase